MKFFCEPPGSLLIIIYVVGIFFVIMNLFYAIIVSTLSDAKIEEDAKQKKKWGVMRDRFSDTWKAAWHCTRAAFTNRVLEGWCAFCREK